MAMEWKTLPVHLLLLLLSVFLIQQVSPQDLSSCAGRCGEGYSRDTHCNCDYNCQHYMECCPDFKKFCTVALSCKGRCSETFERGRECDCDDQCKKYGKCCSDYDDICEVKDNKKENPKKKPAPKPPAVDEAGSGSDDDDSKLTPTPDTPPTQSTKVTTTSKVTTVTTVSPKPSPSPKPEKPKVTSSTASKEKTAETKETSESTKETSESTKETSASTSEKTSSGKETRNAEKTSEDLEATSDSAKTTTEAKTTTTTTTTSSPTTTTTKKPTTTPKKPEPTTPKKPEPTTPKQPESTTPKQPEPTTPKKPEPTTPKQPEPTTPKQPEPTTPKKPALPTPKAPEGTKPETTTTLKDKTTEKGTHTTTEITTATSTAKETVTPAEEKTTESKTSTTKVVTSTTKDTTPPKVTPPEMTPAPEVTAATEETTNSSEDTATDSEVTAAKPPKPTGAPQMPTTTKKPSTTPKVTKPKPTPSPPKTATSTVPTVNPALLQTTTSPIQPRDSEMALENPKNEDADVAHDAEGEKPHVILRPPVLTPLIIPGAGLTVGGPEQGTGIDPMLSDETNLCNGRSVDGLTTLANGTLVAFRGHYFWMLNPLSPPSPPRRITEVWGIPSPIDTVFTRCNCDGKTFFFKDSQYWRFTNDVKDPGYPKQIVKGFGGLNGKILAALSIPTYKERPESVYFFKRGGSVQKYTYKQEPNMQCSGRRPALNYPVYRATTQVRRLRIERDIGSQTHTIRIQYSRPVRVLYQDKGFLHNEAKISTLWRGLPNVVTSAISLPNIRKPDGYDYYAFSRDQAYNINVPSRTARAVITPSGQTLSKVWYNCP